MLSETWCKTIFNTVTDTAISRRAEVLSENAGEVIFVQADVTIKAISCVTGHVIASASEHADKVHIRSQTAGTQVITAAAEKCTKKIFDALIKVTSDMLQVFTCHSLRVTRHFLQITERK